MVVIVTMQPRLPRASFTTTKKRREWVGVGAPSIHGPST